MSSVVRLDQAQNIRRGHSHRASARFNKHSSKDAITGSTNVYATRGKKRSSISNTRPFTAIQKVEEELD